MSPGQRLLAVALYPAWGASTVLWAALAAPQVALRSVLR